MDVDKLLDVDTKWYVGLISRDGFCGINPDDAMSSHCGWIEATDYAGAFRPELPLSGPVSFVMESDQAIVGVFLSSNNAKGGTCGTLYPKKYLLNEDGEFRRGQPFHIGAEFLRRVLCKK